MNLESLNNKQKEAVDATGNVLVVAGAGTGKTRVLTTKIASLINNKIDQKNIYAFTFTNKAAREMKTRVAKLIYNSPSCNISTFHSFFFQELNIYAHEVGFEYPISIIDQDDELKIVRKIIENNHLPIKDSDCIHYISNIKNHIENKYSSLEESVLVGFVFKYLQHELKQINRMDFDDILYYYDRLLKVDPEYLSEMQQEMKYILIDESQDMNIIQYEIISKLAKHSKLFFLVGDQDQCIYTFRGSNLEMINRFKDEFKAKVIILEENYRCNKNILESANNVIKNNIQRIEKNLFTSNEEENHKIFYKGFHTAQEEANYVSNLILRLKEIGYKNEEIVILYRNNMISNAFEKELILKNIPFVVYGAYPFFMHKEIKSLINHYRFCIDQNDDLALSMILNYPINRFTDSENSRINQLRKPNKSLYQFLKEDDNEKSKEVVSFLEIIIDNFNEMSPEDFISYLIDEIRIIETVTKEKNAKEKIARILEFKSFMEAIPEDDHINRTQEMINNIYLQNTSDKKSDSISMMTIHQAKGLEFKVVILVGCNHGIIPSNKSNDVNDEEERRLFYVALTRAKERLFLTSAQRRFVNGKNTYYSPSSFLLEMGIDNF